MIVLPLSLFVYLGICLLTAWLLRGSVAGFWGILLLCFVVTPVVVLLASLLLRPNPSNSSSGTGS
ncbi:MAG: hypothetical protein JNM48_07025 [Rhodospirillales bacterium]|nr:hypothetical protein [Rhodospirillales bacterium]